jgi:hypothetical protein
VSHLYVQLEDLLVEFLNHCDIGLLEVSNAELEKFQLLTQFSQKAALFISEKRVVVLLEIRRSLRISGENGLEKV